MTETRSQIIGALFDDVFLAERAATDLRAQGLTRVQVSSVEDPGPPSGDGSDEATPGVFFEDHDLRASRFADELTNLGFVPRDANYLVSGVVAGKTLVTADVEGAMTVAMMILRPSTRDIRYGAAGFTPKATAAPAERGIAPEIISRSSRFLAERSAPPEEPVLPEPVDVPIAVPVAKHDSASLPRGEIRVRRERIEETRTITVVVHRDDLVVERILDGAATELSRVTLVRDDVDVRTFPVVVSDLLTSS